VITAFRSKNYDRIPDLQNRVTFTTDEDPQPFLAILATPNGVGVAYLLFTHKETFGLKQVKSVTIWVDHEDGFALDEDTDSALFEMLFEIEDVDDPIAA
jgi:hypothetical protein